MLLLMYGYHKKMILLKVVKTYSHKKAILGKMAFFIYGLICAVLFTTTVNPNGIAVRIAIAGINTIETNGTAIAGAGKGCF